MSQQATPFCLQDQNEQKHCLDDYRGKWVLLYFYPKDDTGGCTKEACALREVWDDFKQYNAVVLGVSGDTTQSHKKFEQKYELPFTLLADTDRTVMKSYGVIKKKSLFGKTALGISRESFLIDPEGNIFKHYKKVKPAMHALEVLEDLKKATN